MTGNALITGGQQGIGLGIARALRGAGWRIALMSERDEDDPAVDKALSLLPGAVHVTHDIAEDRWCARRARCRQGRHRARSPRLSPNAGVPAMVRGRTSSK